jgi:holo-[acyl-carrier protein] synthase
LAENGENMASLAARFAAKEAVAKAFGTGIGQISWHDIEICRGISGEPVLKLHGAAQRLAEKDQLANWSISLSHSQNYAIAFVVAMGK